MEKSEITKTIPSAVFPVEKRSQSEQDEYCDVCYLAFGSQEPRKRTADKVAHLDCARRL
jgi:hypothetical protein